MTKEGHSKLIEERNRVQLEIEYQKVAMQLNKKEKTRAETELEKIREEQEKAKMSLLNEGKFWCFLPVENT